MLARPMSADRAMGACRGQIEADAGPMMAAEGDRGAPEAGGRRTGGPLGAEIARQSALPGHVGLPAGADADRSGAIPALPARSSDLPRA